MIIIQLIKNNDPKVAVFKYKKYQYYLEQTLRGSYADLILVHGLKIEDTSLKLMQTLKLCVASRKGLIIFMSDKMVELFR